MSIPFRTRKAIILLNAIFILVFALSACNLPFSIRRPVTEGTSTVPVAMLTEVAGTIEAQPGATGLPESVLTEVAATLYAAETSLATMAPPTSEAGAPLTSTPTKPPPKPTASSTMTPTATQSVIPSSTSSPVPVITYPPYTPIAPIGGALYSDVGFQLRAVNITWCNGLPWAIFRVYNSTRASLESLMLVFNDGTTSSFLYGPFVSDWPFMWTDKQCESGGIDTLPAKNTLYMGTTLGNADVRGHTIQAIVTLCSKEGLRGSCYQKTVEFVMP